MLDTIEALHQWLLWLGGTAFMRWVGVGVWAYVLGDCIAWTFARYPQRMKLWGQIGLGTGYRALLRYGWEQRPDT